MDIVINKVKTPVLRQGLVGWERKFEFISKGKPMFEYLHYSNRGT